MSGNRWGSEGPPPEAYSRVTNPERFRPLHDVALELLGRLEATFNVERLEGYGLDQEQEKRSDLARSSVKLIPRNPDAAPMVVVFTAFPGLLVRLGQWREEAFPSCGCDACDETADDEATRLAKMVDNVTAGRFREAIGLPLIGRAWQESKLWSPEESKFWLPRGRSSSRFRIDRSCARQVLRASDRSSFERGRFSSRVRIDRSRARQMLRASDRSSFEWKPWPRNEEAVSSDAV